MPQEVGQFLQHVLHALCHVEADRLRLTQDVYLMKVIMGEVKLHVVVASHMGVELIRRYKGGLRIVGSVVVTTSTS